MVLILIECFCDLLWFQKGPICQIPAGVPWLNPLFGDVFLIYRPSKLLPPMNRCKGAVWNSSPWWSALQLSKTILAVPSRFYSRHLSWSISIYRSCRCCWRFQKVSPWYKMIQIAEVETLSYFYDKDANTIPVVPTAVPRTPGLHHFFSFLGCMRVPLVAM